MSVTEAVPYPEDVTPESPASQLGSCNLGDPGRPTRAATVLDRVGQGARWFQGICARTLVQQKYRRLRVRETISLGEKRFLSIVEVDGKEFLIGGGNAGVSLLTPLSQPAVSPSFEHTLNNALHEATTA